MSGEKWKFSYFLIFQTIIRAIFPPKERDSQFMQTLREVFEDIIGCQLAWIIVERPGDVSGETNETKRNEPFHFES